MGEQETAGQQPEETAAPDDQAPGTPAPDDQAPDTSAAGASNPPTPPGDDDGGVGPDVIFHG
jgi:hypothetical protein